MNTDIYYDPPILREMAVLRDLIQEQADRLNSIADLARQYNHAGCNADLHAAMNRVLELATGERREYR
jgi:hypothetical protein